MNKVSSEKDEQLMANILSAGFLFKLLERLGYGLEMRKCLICTEKLESGGNFFDASLGGVICEKCSRRGGRVSAISDEAVKMIRIFSQNKIENLGKIRIDKKNLDNLKIILNEAVQWVMG
jgi:DNA repair protein RecO (recombination protein O)